MADYYRQAWDAGPGDWDDVPDWEKAPFGTDPADALYPYALSGQYVRLQTGLSPIGDYALVTGSGGDSQVVGYLESGLTEVPFGSGVTRCVRIKCKPTAAAIADNAYGIFVEFGAQTYLPYCKLDYDPQDELLHIIWEDWNDGTISDTVALAVADIQDEDLTFWFIVKCTSAAQGTGVGPDDGFVRVYARIGSAATQLLYEQTSVAPYLNWVSGQATRLNKIEMWQAGYFGLLGEHYELLISDDSSPVFVPPTPPPYTEPTDASEPCCGSGSITPTQGQTGEISEVNPYGPRALLTSTTTCVGGGTVPTAAPLTDPEDWRTLQGATPNVLCELVATKHPATLGSTTYRWADQGLDLPLSPAHVEGRVRKGGWSEIRRAMPLPDQYPEVGRAGVTIDEQDALLRTLLDSESTAYLTGREYVEWLVSETRRKASGTMLALFRGVVALFNPGPGRTYTIEVEDQLASPGGIFDLNKLLPQAVIDYEFFGPGGDDGTDIHPTRYGGVNAGQLTRGAHTDLIGTPIPILGGICSDRGATAIDGQSAEKGAVPLIWTRDCYLPGHLDQLFGELLVCLGDVAGIEDVYASDLGYDGASPSSPARPPKRININATIGIDLFTPEDVSTWPFETPYRERTVNGRTLRYKAVYLRGPRMQQHRDGLLTATANVCGPMGVNGQVITQVGPFLQWFFNEHVAANNGEGYRSGDYHTLATYASDATVPYVQASTFADFQTYSEARIDDGYLVKNFQLRTRKALREIERQFMQDYEVSFPINRQGQKMCRWPNWQTDATTGTLYRERIEIDEPLPPYRDAHEDIENANAFVCDYDHDLQAFRREAETLRDDDSIAAHKGLFQGGRRLADGQTITPFEVYSTSDVATVRDSFSRRLARKARAMRYQSLPTEQGLYEELGDQIRLTHSRGVGASGYVARPFQVIEHRINPNRKHVTLTTMDLTRLRSGIGYAAEDATPVWASATDADKALYVYATEDDGTVAGTLGKRAA